MILVDYQIERQCNPDICKEPLILPFKRENLQPASVDLCLSEEFLIPRGTEAIDLNDVKGTAGRYDRLRSPEGYTIEPSTFILGSTQEYIQVPVDLVASIEGKSSLGRLGLVVHVTAGWIDPGFKGQITLELFNLSNRPIVLRPGLCICQIAFSKTAGIAHTPYGAPGLNSKYQNQNETTASRYQG